MIIDLHTHTKPLSDDSDLQPIELIHRAKQAGLDGICFTEHDWFWKKDALARLSQEQDFLILPGIEMNTDEGHIIVFGIEEFSFGMYNPEYLKRIVDAAGGVTILTHPYRRHLYYDDNMDAAIERCCQKPLFRLVDAIEVLNGRGLEWQNRFSTELCRRLNLKGVGGSDAHSTSDIPSCATCL